MEGGGVETVRAVEEEKETRKKWSVRRKEGVFF